MPELLRPLPARSWRARLAERAGGLTGLARPARLITAVIAVVVLGVAAWWLVRSPAAAVEDRLPRATAARTTAASATARSPAVTTSATAAPTEVTDPASVLVVQAAGSVVHPGIYRLGAGARVADLVAAAGGPSPGADLDAVALASKLADGQRVYVPVQGEVAAGAPVASGSAGGGGSAATTGAPTADAPLDLNLATVAQLEQLPGVGPATAAAIVAYRDKHGPFRAVEELLDVRGIGTAKLDAIRDLVRV